MNAAITTKYEWEAGNVVDVTMDANKALYNALKPIVRLIRISQPTDNPYFTIYKDAERDMICIGETASSLPWIECDGNGLRFISKLSTELQVVTSRAIMFKLIGNFISVLDLLPVNITRVYVRYNAFELVQGFNDANQCFSGKPYAQRVSFVDDKRLYVLILGDSEYDPDLYINEGYIVR